MSEATPLYKALYRLLSAAWTPGGFQLPDPASWSGVARLARTEHVEAMLHASLQAAPAHAAPQEIAQSWERAYYQTAQRNMLRKRDLAAILQSFAAAGIPVLLFKGLALAETLYGNLGLRRASDLDLAVRPESLPTCRQILLDLGYAPVDIELAPGTNLAFRNEEVYADPEHMRTPVELHWHLLDVPYYLHRVPMAWFWGHARPHRIAGQTPHILDSEANLIYLSTHLALHHRFQGLRWFVDLARLTHQHQQTLDWEAIAHAAQAFELLLVVRETVERLAARWPALPLDRAQQRLHALEPTSAERRLYRLLTAEPRTPLLDFCGDLASLPNLRARVRFALVNVFPQRAYMARRYGVQRHWQLSLWYAYRLGDGLVKLARTLPQAWRLRRP
jgi:hypothetical protein